MQVEQSKPYSFRAPGSAAYECQHGSVSWPCPEVLDLASVWSDHPDYREEWAA
jgi:hypothetical protein